MSILPIIRLGHPTLRSTADAVDPERIETPELQTLFDDMFETMFDAAGVGLAAPQIGLPLQIFVYGLAKGLDDPEPSIPPHVVINPILTPAHGDLVSGWEGCLSIPDMRGLVPRYPQVRVQALDRDGKRLDFVAEGYEARIIQHEFDHLNGVVFLDRMRDLRSLCFEEEWEEFVAETETSDEVTAVG